MPLPWRSRRLAGQPNGGSPTHANPPRDPEEERGAAGAAEMAARVAFLRTCPVLMDALSDGAPGDAEAVLRHVALDMTVVELRPNEVFADSRQFMNVQSLYLVCGGTVEVFAPDQRSGDDELVGVVLPGQFVGMLRELYKLPKGAYAKVKHGDAVPLLARPAHDVRTWLAANAENDGKERRRWRSWLGALFRKRTTGHDEDGHSVAAAPTSAEETVAPWRGDDADAAQLGTAVLYRLGEGLVDRLRLVERLRARHAVLEDLLSYVPLFATMSKAQRRLLSDSFKRVSVPPDRALALADSDVHGGDDMDSIDDDDPYNDAATDMEELLEGTISERSSTRSGTRRSAATDLYDDEVRARRNRREQRAVEAAARRQYRSWRGLVVRQGEEGDAFYIVVSGQLVALLDPSLSANEANAVGDVLDDEGRIVPRGFGFEVAQYRRGGFFGELALLSGEPRKATVKNASGVERAELMKCSAEDFERKVLCMPGVRETLEKTMASVAAFNRMRLEERRVEDERIRRRQDEQRGVQSVSPSPLPRKHAVAVTSAAATARSAASSSRLSPSSASPASPLSPVPQASGRSSYMRRVVPSLEGIRAAMEFRPPTGDARIAKLVRILGCTLGLEGLREAELRRLVKRELVLCLLRPNEVLYTEDDPARAIFVIEAGKLLTRRHESGNPNMHRSIGAYSPPGSRDVSLQRSLSLVTRRFGGHVSLTRGASSDAPSPGSVSRRDWVLHSPAPALPGAAVGAEGDDEGGDDPLSHAWLTYRSNVGRGDAQNWPMLEWGEGREGELEANDVYQMYIHGDTTFSLGPCDVVGDVQCTFDIPFTATAMAGPEGCKLWMLSRRSLEMANGVRDARARATDRAFLGTTAWSGEAPLLNQFVDRAEALARWTGARFRRNDHRDSWRGMHEQMQHLMSNANLMCQGSLLELAMWHAHAPEMRRAPGWTPNFFPELEEATLAKRSKP